ncbi:hypothetical protein CDAR_447141 [Caerostris darwini]|uniref:Uncharacterized protein n=1 Tax=Caerostris darwini TaxID=1538125 RepID=A0AAV4P8T3_9ARAC|nr:hypothetical protein CDAR_447141 [Caerostris darwini]
MPQNVPQKVSTNWKLFKSTLSENTPFLPPTINNNDDIDTEIENLTRNIIHLLRTFLRKSLLIGNSSNQPSPKILHFSLLPSIITMTLILK